MKLGLNAMGLILAFAIPLITSSVFAAIPTQADLDELQSAKNAVQQKWNEMSEAARAAAEHYGDPTEEDELQALQEEFDRKFNSAPEEKAAFVAQDASPKAKPIPTAKDYAQLTREIGDIRIAWHEADSETKYRRTCQHHLTLPGEIERLIASFKERFDTDAAAEEQARFDVEQARLGIDDHL